MSKLTIALLGALDTKGAEYGFVRDRLLQAGVESIVVDFGVLGTPQIPVDIGRDEVAKAGGAQIEDLAAADDRGAAMEVMTRGATEVINKLVSSGRVHGALALGGTGGTSVTAAAFRDLPLGFPRLILSTAASGNTEQYIGETDLILAPSVVDIAGLNRISLRVLANAAAAVAGMVNAAPLPPIESKPLIAASMFGVTTASVTHARARLEELGYEVLVFHMTGSGGRAMESLIRQGLIDGVLDMTTTELADNLVGGVFSAGPHRLTAAAETGVAQVISVGALDMVNFGPTETVPPEFRDRRLYVHNSSVTLMRTTPAECAQLGAELASKVSGATGPVTVVLPLGGISAIAVPGAPFHDPVADDALFTAIRNGLADSTVQLIESELDINHPEFATAAADLLHELIRQRTAAASTTTQGK